MATVRNVQLEEKDFEDRPNYDDLEGDYISVLTEVTDIEAKNTDNYGWGFVFDVHGLPLTLKVWLKGGGKWKVREVFNALGQPLQPGQDTSALDPNPLVGRTCIVTVVKEKGDDGKTWTNISRAVPLDAKKEDAPAVADFSDLEVTTKTVEVPEVGIKATLEDVTQTPDVAALTEEQRDALIKELTGS